MRAHLAYLRYVLRHKWFVFRACKTAGCSLWRGLIHDWSKFLPSEWVPYVRCFYAPDGSKQYKEGPEFAAAWNLHQKRNHHHWQFWLLTWDRGETQPIPMPEKYVREMLADWIGAGMAISGRADPWPWYAKNRHKMILHRDTQARIETLLVEGKGSK